MLVESPAHRKAHPQPCFASCKEAKECILSIQVDNAGAIPYGRPLQMGIACFLIEIRASPGCALDAGLLVPRVKNAKVNR